MAAVDLTLYVKVVGAGGTGFKYSWINTGQLSRGQMIAAMRALADKLEEEGKSNQSPYFRGLIPLGRRLTK